MMLDCPKMKRWVVASVAFQTLWWSERPNGIPAKALAFTHQSLNAVGPPSSSRICRALNVGLHGNEQRLPSRMRARKDDDDEDRTALDRLLLPFQQLLRDSDTKSRDPTKKNLTYRLFSILLGRLREMQDSVNPSALRTAVVSFVAGLFIATTAIVAPVVMGDESSVMGKIEEPVTLFGTILHDLDDAYVETVDVRKLFETGVQAMLGSLDPYTEFESQRDARDMNENVNGKYAGVGLIIGGRNRGDEPVPGDDPTSKSKANYNKGIRVVSAMEGYAYDVGMRVGDKLIALDGDPITDTTTVEDVRDRLRGAPGTEVAITFERDGVPGRNTLVIPRRIVRLRTVKLATLLDNANLRSSIKTTDSSNKNRDKGADTIAVRNNIGYIQLNNFAQDTGPEMRNAIRGLQERALERSGGTRGLEGLILDLRGNPGGLLTSAVDVASLFVPKDSDIVSARGRGFPSVLYRSRVEPLVSPDTRVAVLVDRNTASAAEIVSGAIQDLDVGVMVGDDRTFGKGLVQNVEELPFQTALKFTVAKYYTPSGRCIQSTNYNTKAANTESAENANSAEASPDKEGSVDLPRYPGPGYTAVGVREDEKSIFYTAAGRAVKDGGGIEVDYVVPAPKASALEITLLRNGAMTDFAAEWSKTNRVEDVISTSGGGVGVVTDNLYREFIDYVERRQKSPTDPLQLEALYSNQISSLRRDLERSDFPESRRTLEALQKSILKDIRKDFEKHRRDIEEDVGNAILARYLPESMLAARSLRTDVQVGAAADLLAANDGTYDRLLTPPGNENGNNNNNPGGLSVNGNTLASKKTAVPSSTTSSLKNGATGWKAER